MIVRERTDDVLVHPKNVYSVIKKYLDSLEEVERDKERFFAIGVDSRNRVKYIDVVSVGCLNYNIVHPRETFRTAIAKGVAALFICHNHPSGNLEPSEEDITLTKRLANGGNILGIEVVDHIIIGDGYFSFKMKGML